MELPPRTRRILVADNHPPQNDGTTSAHAENTNTLTEWGWGDWNYLRARGEYHLKRKSKGDNEELPPRTRRIPLEAYMKSKFGGTTSAHAENTDVEETWILANPELPPRTRRIPPGLLAVPGICGTTSAHAENTFALLCGCILCGNYLRARGEYCGISIWHPTLMELPPRTRRIRSHLCPAPHASGTTSAHAENTVTWQLQ